MAILAGFQRIEYTLLTIAGGAAGDEGRLLGEVADAVELGVDTLVVRCIDKRFQDPTSKFHASFEHFVLAMSVPTQRVEGKTLVILTTHKMCKRCPDDQERIERAKANARAVVAWNGGHVAVELYGLTEETFTPISF